MSDGEICTSRGFKDQGLHTENKGTQVEWLFSLYTFIINDFTKANPGHNSTPNIWFEGT